MATIYTEGDLMYQVAEDWEAAVLDDLRRRAGLTWEHEGCWTNLITDDRCGKCGAPYTQDFNHMDTTPRFVASCKCWNV